MNALVPMKKTVVLAGVLAMSLAGGAALAKGKSNDDAHRADVLDNVSQESAVAMRDIRAARLAIFEGDPSTAKQLVGDAQKNLTAAAKNAPRTRVTVKTEETLGNKTIAKTSATETADLVPVDAWLGLSEDFVPTQAKKDSIKKADEHLKAGDRAKALATLKEADIGVSVTRVLMPMDATEKQVTQAATLLSQDKYYEANLALREAEGGLITDTVLLYAPNAPASNAAG